MTTNATLRSQFTFCVDDNTLGLILQRVQQISSDGVPVAAYCQVKIDSTNSLNTGTTSLLAAKCGTANAQSCNYVKLVPGTTNSNTSNDSIYLNRVANFLTTLAIVYVQKQVIQILNPPQTLPGSPGAPSSILDTLNCPPDLGPSIEVLSLFLGAMNTIIVEVKDRDITRAFNILNSGQGNTCNRNTNLIKNCDPFGCVQQLPGFIPFNDTVNCRKNVICMDTKKNNSRRK